MADNENNQTQEYVHHTWQDGDLVTTARMNNIENGIDYIMNHPVSDEKLNEAVRNNVSADTLQAVTYSPDGFLDDADLRRQARVNIGAISSDDLIGLADTQIRITKNDNNGTDEYPILISSIDKTNLVGNKVSVEAQINTVESKNPTVNYSTGTLKAARFEGSGAGLAEGSIPDSAINKISASKITGSLSIEHGGTGAGNVTTARKNLEVLAAKDIAPYYKTSEQYRKGDYCIQEINGELGLYRCGVDSTTGEWASGNWTKIDVGTAINQLNAVTPFIGTTSSEPANGLVPAPATTDIGKFLASDGTWKEVVTDIDFDNRTVTGTLSVANGGTGATTSADALEALGGVSTTAFGELSSVVTGLTTSINNIANTLTPENIGAASVTDLAARYSDSAEYKIGDYCIYENHLYKCTTAIDENGESWNSEHWAATTVDEAMELAAQAAAAAVSGVVRYDTNQLGILTTAQQDQARANIDAVSESEFETLAGRVSSAERKIADVGNRVTNITKSGDNLVVSYATGDPTTVSLATDFPLKNISYSDDTNNLYFWNVDEVPSDLTDVSKMLFSPVHIQGGGGSGSNAGNITITRNTAATIDSISNEPILLSFGFSAVDSDNEPTGDGLATWSVNGNIVASNITVKQGNNSFDISPYVDVGRNDIRLSISADTGGESNQIATKPWTVNIIDMRFIWNYNDAQINQTGFNDRITVYGNVSKTIHTLLDGVALDTVTTDRSNYETIIEIPMQTHGVHTIEHWLSATIGSTNKTTAHQYHEAIFVQSGNTTPIIAISMKNTTVSQYNTIQIPVMLYDPTSLTTNAILKVNNEEVGRWEDYDRQLHYWYYTPLNTGSQTLSVTCGSVTKSITLTVESVSINAQEINGYTYKFKASDFIGNDAVKNWNSGNNITATFSQNFDWINGGLHAEKDENDNLQQYFCIKAGTSMTINHQMFGTDPVENGMNFKIIFKVKNVREYDTEIVNCFANNIGLKMTAHEAILKSSGTTVSVPYGEDEYIELEYDIYPSIENNNQRYAMAWLDGVITSCRVYGDGDSFVHPTNNKKNLVIGSQDCDIYIYMIKLYPMFINRENHLDNFIMDAPNAIEMTSRYNRNNILDPETGEISPTLLLQQNPNSRVWLYDIPYFTNSKDDKVSGCKFQQRTGDNIPENQIDGEGKMSIQGTSSVDYIRGAANTDINFSSLSIHDGENLLLNSTKDETYGNNYFIEDEENPGHVKVYTVIEAREEAGLTESSEILGPEWVVVTRDSNKIPTHYIKAVGYKINEDSCPITYVNTKVNFASCEQVNNMCNAAWYQRFNPYPSLTARDCMEFEIGVQFIKDGHQQPDQNHFELFPDNKYHMYSIANMGNSKKNIHIFHDLSNPNEVCIEVNDNTARQMRMLDDDLSAENWGGKVYFGMRYPDTKNPSQQIKNAWARLVSWMAEMNLQPYDAENNPNGYTNELLSEPETYGNYTFRGHDRAGTQVLRGTTVTQYAGTYTHDTFERRMAKMLSECEDYMVMDSFIYHYLYLERHTMVDNVSKNNFWSSTDLIHWDLSKAYDMDTSDGNNNQGKLVFDYGNEWNDLSGTTTVFNANDSVWFVFCANLYEACRTMFINREMEGAWSGEAYHKFLTSQQKKLPERVWNQCYWYDYLRTYENNINGDWITFLDGGQKIHQRHHYEYFEELYDSSKYTGITATSPTQKINFRAYKPEVWGGVEPKGEISIQMYNKMYISMEVGTTAVTPIKAQRGEKKTIPFPVEVSASGTQINLHTASMIQKIEGLDQLYPNTCNFSAGVRLRELNIGSNESGYNNDNLFDSLSLDNNYMLQRLYVQNLPAATFNLNLSHCPELVYIDARGSGFTGYSFADGGLLNEAHLEKPTSITLQNLAYLTNANFTIEDYSDLLGLRCENTDIDILSIINAATNLSIIRLTGIDWTLITKALLDSLANMQGYNENNKIISQSVLSGEATINTLSERMLNYYKTIWPGLDIDALHEIEEHLITFINDDGTPVLDKQNNPYTQWVESESQIEEPISAGYIETPTKPDTPEWHYEFSGWSDNINTQQVTEAFEVTANFTATKQKYTVRWFLTENSNVPIKTLDGNNAVPYGTEVNFNDDPYVFPTRDPESGYYYVFKGWNKSTGFITGNTDVYGVWETGTKLSSSSTKLMSDSDVSIAQIYATAVSNKLNPLTSPLPSNWRDNGETYKDIQVGRDYNYNSIESIDIITSPMYFDGVDSSKVIIFNGQNNRPEIKLFDVDSPSFTLAIDFEYSNIPTTANTEACLVSCLNGNAATNSGLKLTASSNLVYPTIRWGGDQSQPVGGQLNRNIVVIRHQKGTQELFVYYNNTSGQLSNDSYSAQYVGSIGTTQNGYQMITQNNITHNGYLVLGGIADSTGSTGQLAAGTIHWCKLWKADLGERDSKAMAAWPHETWRMIYTGLQKYQPGGETDQYKNNMEFIINNGLTLKYPYAGIVNTPVWENSIMRSFLNSQVFAALPIEWQYIIKSTNITSIGPSGEVTTVDKLYIPSLEDINGTSDKNGIPFMAPTGDATSATFNRIYFPGINTIELDTNKQINFYTNEKNQDPTQYSNAVINSGRTVWIIPDYDPYNGFTYNRAWIFFDADYCSKHKVICGRYINESCNITPAGNYSGGKWIMASSWYTRTGYTNQNYPIYTVEENGSINNWFNSKGEPKAIVFEFSI